MTSLKYEEQTTSLYLYRITDVQTHTVTVGTGLVLSRVTDVVRCEDAGRVGDVRGPVTVRLEIVVSTQNGEPLKYRHLSPK